MNATYFLFAFSGLTLSACAPILTAKPVQTVQQLDVAQPSPQALPLNFKLTSLDFPSRGTLNLAQVADGFGCTGGNISPALSWSGVPEGTESLALTLFDPDAPTGSGFWHWVVYNLPARSTSLNAGAGTAGGTLPAGAAQLKHDGGQAGFLGACPPVGDQPHRYVLTLYALSQRLDLPNTVSPAYLGFNLNGITLAKASVTAFYGR
ncbi:YbhB/YbcL family Raf kinase inhibitor-like protein [Deinococcus oregonensis]|uniref:YbhB/YbcL family Raf kinase inhibitor-like protein n=1 Tax=Deinococcus oregonensis TaxID=1805970 RepID=A0ABV6AX94_9DEIO